jgi:hypothetical protein
MFRIYLFAIIVLLSACGGDASKPDVSDIKVDLSVERFEQSLFKIDTTNIGQGLAGLRKAYPTFFPVYMQNILQLNPMDTATYPVLRNILTSYRPIYDSLEEKYRDLGWLKRDLTEGFQYVKHYYPQYRVPRILTFIATLDAPGVVLTPEHLGIGLHQYAGKNFSVYQAPELQQVYPTYISRRFDKEYMVANSMKAIVDDVYPDQSVGQPLVEQMVEKGKQWYLLAHFLPDAPDSVLTGYTQKQLDWAEENEGNVWAYIIKNENLYGVEPHVIQTYIGESPFTQGMPETSPGNIGQWIGWRIVQQYARKNEKLTLQQVLQTPARTIFQGAAYRPK